MSDHEMTSLEEAGGVATGFTGTIENWNADAEAKMAETLMAVGRFVQGESGCLLGHIKAAVFLDDGSGLTLNLIDMDNGVEHHGSLARNDLVKFNFMCAVLDVEEFELQHKMIHAIDDSGLDYHIDKESLKHHHHHDHEHGECSCGHDHEEHEHHYDENGVCSCGHHHHDHDHDHEEHEHHHEHGECSCGHHHDHEEHEHEHHYDENGVCSCGHHHHDCSDMIGDDGKLRADHHHHHDHDHDHEEHEHHHEHGECCCGHHHHD